MFYVAPLALIALVGLAADGVVTRRRRAARRRRGRRGRAAGLHPVRPLHHDERGRRHASRCCRGGGCRTTGSTSTRCAGPRSPSRSPRPRCSSGCRAGTRSSCRRSSPGTSSLTHVRRRERPPRDPPGLGRQALGRASASPHPDWIDRAVGRDASVAYLWTGGATDEALWENEFFNRSLGAGLRASTGAAARPAARDRRSTRRADGRLRDADGTVVRAEYVARRRLDRRRRARRSRSDPAIGLTLYRVNGPLVLLGARRRASTPTPGRAATVTYRRLDCPAAA